MALRAIDLIEKNCLNCHEKFKTQYRNVFRGRGKYCSRFCSNTNLESRIAKRKKQLDSGIASGYRKHFGDQEHRAVMESILGRKLIKGEVVHHKDGSKRNNKPENLQLFQSNGEHLREHLLKSERVNCSVENCSNQKLRNHQYFCDTHYKKYLLNRKIKLQETSHA